MRKPLQTWWKARKYFKFPQIKFHTYKINHWFGFEWHDVWYKYKYDSVRHEFDPYIAITLFKRVFRWDFTMYAYLPGASRDNVSMEYWEYLLNYLDTGSLLKGLQQSGRWKGLSPIWKDDYYIESELFSLNSKGLK